MRIRYCMACKVEPSTLGGFCAGCNSKKCSKCGRVSVHGTRWDEKGKPYCPTCFKKLILIASHIEGKTDLPTLENRLTQIENRLDRLESYILGRSEDLQTDRDISPSNELKTKSRRRDFPSLASGADLDSRIDSLLENTDIPAPSVDDIKNRALEIMLESDRMAETIESETDKPEE